MSNYQIVLDPSARHIDDMVVPYRHMVSLMYYLRIREHIDDIVVPYHHMVSLMYYLGTGA